MRLVKKFFRLSTGEKLLFAEAVILIFFSKVVFLLFPFRVAIKLIKPNESFTKQVSSEELEVIKTAIRRANKLAFWKNICLVQSFAARLMLQRRSIPSVMHFGLTFKNSRELCAHAWLKSNEIFITPRGVTNYKEIFSV